MSIINNLWGSASYIAAVVIAAVLVGGSMPKKKHFWIKMSIAFCGIVITSYVWDKTIFFLQLTPYVHAVGRSMSAVAVFLLSTLLMKICYECSQWEALFSVTAGYCMEHFSFRLAELMKVFFPMSTLVSNIVVVLSRVVVYLAMYVCVFRRSPMREIETDNRLQVMIALMIIMFAILVNGITYPALSEQPSKVLSVIICLYPMGLCFIALFVELYQVYYQAMKKERDILQQIIELEKGKYEKEKETIGVINMKYHDLKHQLHQLEAEYGKERLQELRQVIDDYGSIFRTGSVALDTVLSLKNYNCMKKKIQLTCMANGDQLICFSEADIYTVFGNILDNAIEAVEELPEAYRIISLNVNCQNSFILIHCENYCAQIPVFIDGMPQTTKGDKNFHGFGTHSLRSIVEHYNGICTFGTKENIFYTDIVLPI